MSVQDLESLMRKLEKAPAAFSQDLRYALQYIETDAASSLTKSRLVLEKVLVHVYTAEMAQEPRKRLLGDLLVDNQFTRRIDRRILVIMNSIRDMGNLGPHGEPVEPRDAARVLDLLCDVLEWYSGRYPMNGPAQGRRAQFRKADFARLSQARRRVSIDRDVRLKNLAKGDWRYDGLLLPALRESGWIRFAVGFKSGLYGHATHPFCIKVLGMGVGDDPSYFAGRGYYNEHERRMLESFASKGFRFQPRAQSVEESIAFLNRECGVNADQARWQCENHHVLITERVFGIPFATATGHGLSYEPDIAVFDSAVLGECERALHELQRLLGDANRAGLLHNDPMPANVVFEQGDRDRIIARLVDFELAQDLGGSTPDHVASSVREQYAEREVPLNVQTGKHRSNLDQHLLEQGVTALGQIRRRVEEYEAGRPGMNWLAFSFSFVGGIIITFGEASCSWLGDAGVI